MGKRKKSSAKADSAPAIDTRPFRVERSSLDLDKCPTAVEPIYRSREHYEELLDDQVKRLSRLQEVLYASNRYALLVVFQGMDTSGKDGAIKHVMSGVNPQGCSVVSFKHPSATELEHDFLWRCARELPERGQIGVFNRSYYEEVVVVRVHPELLAAENLPDTPDDLWKQRYQAIRNLEEHLCRSGTRVVKFFLHVSRDEQRRRLLERIDDPDKRWKFNSVDVRERNYWRAYMRAYEKAIAATSTEHAPWYVVPADDKLNARLIVSQAIVETLAALRMEYPPVAPDVERELATMRESLVR